MIVEQQGNIKMIMGDCMEYMRKLPDKAYDLAIVDPPYGINAPAMKMGSHETRKTDGYPATSTADRLRKGRLNTGAGKLKNRALNTMPLAWDYETPGSEYFEQLFRISREQIIWGGNYFDLPPTRGIVCWDKMQPWDNFSQWEMAWTSFDRPARLYRLSNTGGANKEKKIHPTQKPVALYKWLLEKFASPDLKIIDTHGGSMPLAIAGHDFGCEVTVIEKDAEYYAEARKRLIIHQQQQKLF